MTLEQQIENLGESALRIKAQRDHLRETSAVLLELLDDYMLVSSLTKNDRYAVALEDFRGALAAAMD